MSDVTSVKKTIGLCFGAYVPLPNALADVPQPVAGRSSWYDFQEMPAAFSSVTRCCAVVDWLLELGSPSPVNV
jgi:hypothetical protein